MNPKVQKTLTELITDAQAKLDMKFLDNLRFPKPEDALKAKQFHDKINGDIPLIFMLRTLQDILRVVDSLPWSHLGTATWAWVQSNKKDGWTFLAICQALELDANQIRKQLTRKFNGPKKPS